MDKGKKLYRNTDEQMIAGVCSGIADYVGMDKTMVRLLWVLGGLCIGFGIIGYIIAAIIIPAKPSDVHQYTTASSKGSDNHKPDYKTSESETNSASNKQDHEDNKDQSAEEVEVIEVVDYTVVEEEQDETEKTKSTK